MRGYLGGCRSRGCDLDYIGVSSPEKIDTRRALLSRAFSSRKVALIHLGGIGDRGETSDGALFLCVRPKFN